MGKKEGEVDTIIERNFNARTGEEKSGVGRKECIGGTRRWE